MATMRNLLLLYNDKLGIFFDCAGIQFNTALVITVYKLHNFPSRYDLKCHTAEGEMGTAD